MPQTESEKIPIRDYSVVWTNSFQNFGDISKTQQPFEMKCSNVSFIHLYRIQTINMVYFAFNLFAEHV